MFVTKPAYFDQFSCIAGDCPDSCCKEWQVLVDPDSAQRYRSLPGPLGDRLRQVLTEEEGRTYMTVENGRCPMWRDDGLCRIQAQLGEDALCHVCREFPRLRHDYGDFVELGLELSCPVAAELILEDRNLPPVTFREAEAGEAEYDREAMEVLLSSRQKMLDILSDTTRPVGECLTLGVLYGYQVQGVLDGGEETDVSPETALESARELAKAPREDALPEFFLGLEILTEDWKNRLNAPQPGPWQEQHRALARYFVQRYWLQAVSDYDLYSRVKLMAVSCILIRHLGGDLTRTAQLYGKEIENNPDNIDAILDAAYASPAMTDDILLGWLLK